MTLLYIANFRKNLCSGFLCAAWLSRNMITEWRRLFKRVGRSFEAAFWSESIGIFSSATPASTWSSSLADAHPGPCLFRVITTNEISAQAAAG